jgi:hypothetical protein
MLCYAGPCVRCARGLRGVRSRVERRMRAESQSEREREYSLPVVASVA